MRSWLLRLLALGFFGLRLFLCVRLGRKLGLRETTAHTTQQSQEHLTTPLLPTHMITRTAFLDHSTCLPKFAVDMANNLVNLANRFLGIDTHFIPGFAANMY